jgi:Ca2+-transporting ATPase
MEWLEGIAILSAVIVVVTVSAVNDYQKDQQFRELSSIKDDVHVFVVRGGTKKKISTHDIVVGDVVMLSTGDMVVADGVVFEKNDLGISEAMLTGESVIKRKGAYNIAPTDSADKAVSVAPTVYAGTFVQEGEGRMVVLAVGRSTYQGLMEEKMKEDEESDSVLQTKLNAMTDLITKAGAAAGGVTVGILLLRFALGFMNQACCKEVVRTHADARGRTHAYTS